MTFNPKFQVSVHLMKMRDCDENGCGTMIIIKGEVLIRVY